MRRTIIAGLMVCLWMLISADAYAFCRDRCFPEQREFEGFCYRAIAGRAIIKGYIGPGGNVVIPDTIDGRPVVKIAPLAFYGCDNLNVVTIPDSVIKIGNRAFQNCTNLSDVIIGNSVRNIGAFAFADCISLREVTIGNNVRRIEKFAFSNCINLACLLIPDSVRVIEQFAFRNCTRLDAVVIGSGMLRIKRAAFWNTTGLTDVYFQGNAPLIGALSFWRLGFGDDLSICHTAQATSSFERLILQWRFNFNNIEVGLCEPECIVDADCPQGFVCECFECVEETLITLSRFEAAWGADGVVVEWITATEIDNFGFNIYRAESADGPFVKINENVIIAQGVPPMGASYQFVDESAVSGATYWYELEDVDLFDGKMRHGSCGPVTDTEGCTYLP